MNPAQKPEEKPKKSILSCSIGNLADRCGVDRETFQDWLKEYDLIEMIKLGWNPFQRALPPTVVKYLTHRFIDRMNVATN